MSNHVKSKQDPFTFSLGGLTSIASFVAPPVIAADRLNQKPEARASRRRRRQTDDRRAA